MSSSGTASEESLVRSKPSSNPPHCNEQTRIVQVGIADINGLLPAGPRRAGEGVDVAPHYQTNPCLFRLSSSGQSKKEGASRRRERTSAPRAPRSRLELTSTQAVRRAQATSARRSGRSVGRSSKVEQPLLTPDFQGEIPSKAITAVTRELVGFVLADRVLSDNYTSPSTTMTSPHPERRR
jgi:hypothetical protein